jgi:hypothetical protein
VRDTIRVIRDTIFFCTFFTALLLTGLKQAPEAILILSIAALACWLLALFSWPESFAFGRRPGLKAGMHIVHFIGFYVYLVCLFGMAYFAVGMLGHYIFSDKDVSPICTFDLQAQTQFDAGQIPEIVRRKFEDIRVPLGENAVVLPEVPGSKWIIKDDERSYTVAKEHDRLDVCEAYVSSRRDFLYFSVITATTLGYGDLFPSDWITRALSLLEVSFGVIFITAVLAVTLAFRHTQVGG